MTVSAADEQMVVRASGEVDAASSPRLLSELQQVAVSGLQRVTVDLSQVSFIDSTGLGVLVTALKRVQEAGGEMLLLAPQPTTRRLLQITGLDQVIPIV